MNKLYKFLMAVSLPFVFLTFGMSVYALTEPEINWYKAGFFFFLMLSNINTFLISLANRD